MRRSREEDSYSLSYEDDENDQGSAEQDPKRQRTNDYGFEPADKPREEPVETEAVKKLKQDINLLICRYPALQPRTSHALMEKLAALSEQELQNVYLNAINDVSELRGTPSAETVLLTTTPIDWKIPGYTDYCMKDVELKRDIESEIVLLFGWLGNKVNIFFRLVNNAYTVYRINTGQKSPDLETTNEAPSKLFAKPITTAEETQDNQRDGASGFEAM